MRSCDRCNHIMWQQCRILMFTMLNTPHLFHFKIYFYFWCCRICNLKLVRASTVLYGGTFLFHRTSQQDADETNDNDVALIKHNSSCLSREPVTDAALPFISKNMNPLVRRLMYLNRNEFCILHWPPNILHKQAKWVCVKTSSFNGARAEKL